MIDFFRNLWSADWYQRNGYYRLAQLVGGGQSTAAGEVITVERAMRCSTVAICTRVITESIASMPFPVMRKDGAGRVEERDSAAWEMLNSKPNSYQSAVLFRRTIGHHALNYGNGFARIDRRGSGRNAEAYAMHIIHPKHFIEKKVSSASGATYKFIIDGQEKVYDESQILHLMNHTDDGLTGIGAVELGKEAIGQALAIEGFGATFFGRGGLKAGLLKKTVPFSKKEDRDRFESDFTAKYRAGKDAFHKNLLVEGDWDYKPIGADPTEAQLTEARAEMVPEICRFYNLTPHLAGDLRRAHYNNVEHLWIQTINIALNPWMTQWEQEIGRVLLTDDQRRRKVYAKHVTAAFMRGDFEARMRAYATLLQNGVFSINDALELEDRDPIEGGDAHHIQLNMQTVPGTGEPTASEHAQLVKVSEGKPKK